jgi:putative nucleotidyltransferase with HDIG domain
MTIGRRPPRLLVKALLVTFGTVVALLLLVFLFVRMSVRDQVRRTVTQNLDVSQRMLAALEERRLHELRSQAETLAENPTLKAAIDTYAAETSFADTSSRPQLLATVQRELDKLAARVDTDAVSLATQDGETLAAAGRLHDGWARDRADARLLPSAADADGEALIEAGGTLFRVVRIPLTLDDGATIAWLDLGSALDMHYAELLDQMSGARTAIVHGSSLVATTMSAAEARDFQSVLRRAPPALEPIELDGSSHVYREIARVGPVRIFALSSVDDAAAAALARMNVVLAVLALGAFALAFIGSTLLARLLSRPIEQLSGAIDQMAAARDLTKPLHATGSSRELDLLSSNFNHLMASVVDAESRTEAAYAAAIRALAAALDARDPYTAGHSERVSTLSVAIGRVLRLPDGELEVLRLGALLHDIGKIGIPDSVLRKPGPLTDEEFEAITEHPVVGARILRTVPFLLPHLDIVELHHERPDGLGYPRGLRGDDIPLLARIVHVADAYDAITSARAYRQGRSSDEALRELWRCAGTEYHADIVSALARALPRLAAVAPEATPAVPLSRLSAARTKVLSA